MNERIKVPLPYNFFEDLWKDKTTPAEVYEKLAEGCDETIVGVFDAISKDRNGLYCLIRIGHNQVGFTKDNVVEAILEINPSN